MNELKASKRAKCYACNPGGARYANLCPGHYGAWVQSKNGYNYRFLKFHGIHKFDFYYGQFVTQIWAQTFFN